MLYELSAPEWRILRRLFIAGSRATRDFAFLANDSDQRVLIGRLRSLGLIVESDQELALSDRGRLAQILGQVELDGERVPFTPSRDGDSRRLHNVPNRS